MKIAISGKGGVGKSTVAAALSIMLAKSGKKVLALDADPDANLAAALGFPVKLRQSIIPLSCQEELIEERTGAKVKKYGQVFKLNPEVSDIAEAYSTKHDGVNLLVIGAVKQGGSGCACPENVLIKSLVSDLILYKEEILIMDMEAGVEHLGRATARGVDMMLIVVEPGQRSIESAYRISNLATEIGIKSVKVVANKVTSAADIDLINKAFKDQEVIAHIPFAQAIRNADFEGFSVTKNIDPETEDAFKKIIHQFNQ